MRERCLLCLLISFLLASACAAAPSQVSAPTAVPTFECIGVYWSPAGGCADKAVLVEYREEGAGEWKQGLPMKYNPIAGTDEDLADYRGSIVNLAPGTAYDIRLTLEGTSTTAEFSANTWSDDFPVGETVRVGDMDSTLTLTTSGRPDGYLLVDGRGATIDVDDKADYCIEVRANYVIIRGFTLKNAKKCGIRLYDCHDVVIEDCDISGWGEITKYGYGMDYQAGVYSTSHSLTRVVVQRCRIHDPRSGANHWGQKNPVNASWTPLDSDDMYHPEGPHGIAFEESAGNHVIRYNEIFSSPGHYFNDILGFGWNSSYRGFPGADSDIYGNYLANCWDDGIEAEGGDRNVRIWNNYLEEVYLPIANASVSIGPLYVWQNVSGRCYSPPESIYGQYGGFMKMGYAGDASWMTGHTYLFNNTVLQPNGEGAGGLGANSPDWGGDEIRHCVTRNNLLHARPGVPSIATNPHNTDVDFDYDLCSGDYPESHEAHGVKGTPIYGPGFGFDREGNFQLSPESKGYRAGVRIPNFCDGSEHPDMGAHQSGAPDIQYGVRAGAR